MTNKVCSYRGCYRRANHGLGWGLSTGSIQWFCAEHYKLALTRLAGLLRCIGMVA